MIQMKHYVALVVTQRWGWQDPALNLQQLGGYFYAKLLQKWIFVEPGLLARGFDGPLAFFGFHACLLLYVYKFDIMRQYDCLRLAP